MMSMGLRLAALRAAGAPLKKSQNGAQNLTNCEVTNRFGCRRGKSCDVLKLSKMSVLPFLRLAHVLSVSNCRLVF